MTATLDPTDGDLLTFSVASHGAAARVTATGEVDSASAPLLQSQLDDLLDAGAREVVVDLDGVSFLDSAGLCVLAATHRRAVAEDVRLRILASSRAVIRPLQITGLFDLLGVEEIAPGTGATS